MIENLQMKAFSELYWKSEDAARHGIPEGMPIEVQINNPRLGITVICSAVLSRWIDDDTIEYITSTGLVLTTHYKSICSVNGRLI